MAENRNSIAGIFKEDDLPDTGQEPQADAMTEAEAVVCEDVLPLTEAPELEPPELEPHTVHEASKADEPSGFKYFLKDILSVVISAIVIALLLKCFVIDTRVVPSGSMIPTINEGDRVIILKFPYFLGKTPARQDVVVFAPPEELTYDDDLLKRVIGMPGDTVEVKDGLVYINGEALEEPYINELPNKDYALVTVPDDCYFMMGDNRNHSLDSREWNDPYVPFSDIKGKVVICYWPVSNLRMVK